MTVRMPHLLLLLAAPLVSVPVSAQPTCELPVSAYVTDGDGAPLDGSIDVELRFYTAAEPEALPVECRTIAEAAVEAGWLRVLLDACEAPPDGDCGVAPLNSVIRSAESLYVGLRVGEAESELAPRLVVGATPYAVRADDAGTLAGLRPEAFERAGALAEHAADADAHHPATSEGIDITPASVEVGGARFAEGVLDFGPDARDELTAAIVRTLTGGGEADALHTHAGGSGSAGGACYTAWGSGSCAEGWVEVYDGYGLAVEIGYTRNASGLYCIEDAAVTETGDSSIYYRLLGPSSSGPEGDYRPDAGELLCAVCCR